MTQRKTSRAIFTNWRHASRPVSLFMPRSFVRRLRIKYLEWALKNVRAEHRIDVICELRHAKWRMYHDK
ncbi:MAG: hypothetical protein LBU11_12435 [Zoogloeaceae bacterium]|jgi:hypothetical protein|nr:hypothetical protein [Zoogloeaceae bacterium]